MAGPDGQRGGEVRQGCQQRVAEYIILMGLVWLDIVKPTHHCRITHMGVRLILHCAYLMTFVIMQSFSTCTPSTF